MRLIKNYDSHFCDCFRSNLWNTSPQSTRGEVNMKIIILEYCEQRSSSSFHAWMVSEYWKHSNASATAVQKIEERKFHFLMSISCLHLLRVSFAIRDVENNCKLRISLLITWIYEFTCMWATLTYLTISTLMKSFW